jgi:VCBS repeat protein
VCLARIARSALAALAACALLPAVASAADYGFTPAAGSPFETNSDPRDTIVADIDGDGFPDAVLGDAYGNNISIFWGDGAGSFLATPYEITGPANRIVVARIDGDADLDIVGAGNTLQPFFKDNGTRTFTPGGSQPVDTGDDFAPAVGLVAADFDQDTDNDIALTAFLATSGGPTGGAVRIFKNQPTGTLVFDHNELSLDEDYFADIAVGQLNAGGDPDLAFHYEGSGPDDDQALVRVYLGGAGVDFTPGADVPTEGFGSIAAGDVDSDGKVDLITDGSVEAHWGKGDGTFEPTQVIDSAFGSGFFFGDFNNDGMKDIGVDGDPVRLLTNKGSRTFALGGQFSSSDFGYHGAAADLDADPRDDLVLGGFLEMVALRTGDPPSDGGGGGGDTTPPPGGGTTPPPPPGPGPGPGPIVVPPGNQPPGTVVPVKASRIAVLPGKRVCGSRRKFRIRLRVPPEGVTVTEARVLVNGKRVKVVRGARLTAPVDLRGLPKGRAVVTIRITLADGRVLRGRRVYHPCAKKKRKGKFGRKRV